MSHCASLLAALSENRLFEVTIQKELCICHITYNFPVPHYEKFQTFRKVERIVRYIYTHISNTFCYICIYIFFLTCYSIHFFILWLTPFPFLPF